MSDVYFVNFWVLSVTKENTKVAFKSFSLTFFEKLATYGNCFMFQLLTWFSKLSRLFMLESFLARNEWFDVDFDDENFVYSLSIFSGNMLLLIILLMICLLFLLFAVCPHGGKSIKFFTISASREIAFTQ